jgi:hypothetical protein
LRFQLALFRAKGQDRRAQPFLTAVSFLSKTKRFAQILRAVVQPLAHDPEKACPALDAGWVPVSRLREARGKVLRLAGRFGGRSQVGKDHAPARS